MFKYKMTPDIKKAFQSYIGIAPAPPVYPEYEEFTRTVNDYLVAAPFNFLNPYQNYGKLKLVGADLVH